MERFLAQLKLGNILTDGEGCGVDGLVAFDYVTMLVDEDEVGDFDEREVGGERVEPEVVGENGVANGAGRSVAGGLRGNIRRGHCTLTKE
jgi:hypothetical protein